MKFLQSKKLAIWLIIALAIASLAGVLGWAAVFRSVWFMLLSLVFLINLSACTLGQIIRLSKLYQTKHRRGQPLSKHFWSLLSNCLFHVGLIIVVVGGILTLACKMAGYVEITEGETFTEEHQNYAALTEGPYFGERHKKFQATVERLERQFKANGELDYVLAKVKLQGSDQQATRFTAGLGQPFAYQGVKFYYSKSGFAPYLTITNPQGVQVVAGYVLLNSVWRNGQGAYYLDMELPSTKLQLHLRYFPDALVQSGTVTARSLKVSNPLVQADLREDKRSVAKLLIRNGQAVSWQGWTFQLADTRLWAGFDVVSDPGAPVVFAGFMLALLCLALGFWFTIQQPGKE